MDQDTYDLETHFEALMQQILKTQPHNLFDNFQNLSHSIKFRKFTKSMNHQTKQVTPIQKQYQEKFKNLIAKINVGTPQQPQEPGPLSINQNILEESKIFQWAGVGFNQQQVYFIYKSLAVQFFQQKLSLKTSSKTLKFWGKILAHVKDYYVAEGIADSNVDDGELSPQVEPRGTGVNALSYWATTNQDWVQLPLVTPDQIRTSREIKYIFTGNLEKQIITNPHFFGKQKHLLKCQIVRISNSSSIIPKGTLKVNQDQSKLSITVREISYPQEWEMPQYSYYKQLSSWVHHPVSILKNGRTTHIKPEIENPDDQPLIIAQIERKDPLQPRLKEISLDKCIAILPAQQGQNLWKIRTYCQNQIYQAEKREYKKVDYSITVIKNLTWRGWTTVFYNGTTTSIYVGYALKTSPMFFPCKPQSILKQAIDKPMFKEPNEPKLQNQEVKNQQQQ